MSILPPRPSVQQVNSRRLTVEGYASQREAVAVVQDEERRTQDREDLDTFRRLAALLGKKPDELQRALLSKLAKPMADIALTVVQEVQR